MDFKRWLLPLLLPLLLVVAACPRKADKPAIDPAISAHVDSCAHAISDAAADTGERKLRLVASGCHYPCSALADRAQSLESSPDDTTRLLEQCGLFCNQKARRAWLNAPPPERFAELLTSCGSDAYGLPAGHANLLSDTWLVLRLIHGWLEQNRAATEPQARTALAQAAERSLFSLPLPARAAGVYELPSSALGRAGDASLYVVVAGTGMRAAAMPVARLLSSEIALQPVPGGDFPGTELSAPAADYAALIAQQAAARPGATVNEIPLVLADASLPASTLVVAAARLERRRITVGVAGQSALMHPIVLEHLTATGSAAPVLRLRGDAITIEGGDEDRRIPASKDGYVELGAMLAELSVRQAPQDKVELSLPATATVAELVALLDVIAQSRFTVALMRRPDPPAGSGSDAGGGGDGGSNDRAGDAPAGRPR